VMARRRHENDNNRELVIARLDRAIQ